MTDESGGPTVRRFSHCGSSALWLLTLPVKQSSPGGLILIGHSHGRCVRLNFDFFAEQHRDSLARQPPAGITEKRR